MSDVNVAKLILKKDLAKIKYSYKMLQAPEETLKNKKGDCFEQVELMRFLLANENINCASYFLEMNRGDENTESWKDFLVHGFVVFEAEDQFHWLERAYCGGKYIGVHSYNNLKELLYDFIEKTIDSFTNDYEMPTNNILIHQYDMPVYPIAYTQHILNCLNSKIIEIDKL